MRFITEPSKQIPVILEADLCVIGGSCTGVFAAVQAARRGLSCCIVEKQNCFGGVATAGMVNVWHSLYSTDGRQQVIGGLTEEMERRLIDRGASVENTASAGLRFNSEHLKIELDRLVQEHRIHPFLHTRYAGVTAENNCVQAVFIENKDGRGAIRARFFIDATGDGDLCRDLRLKSYQYPQLQPPSTVFLLNGTTPRERCDLGKLIAEHGKEFSLIDDWGWFGDVPGLPGISMRADNHVFGVDCSVAEQLTQAEIEGRRQADAFVRLLQKYADPSYELIALAQHIGIRDTRHYHTAFRANAHDLLTGRRYPDAVLNGTYRIDIHHQQDNGITFQYLDGQTVTYYGKTEACIQSNWREEQGLTGPPATYYQLPFSVLVGDFKNLIAAGRMLNADEDAFGALRVMVNLNQLGEAAGVAAAICLDTGRPLQQIDGCAVRALLNKTGSRIV